MCPYNHIPVSIYRKTRQSRDGLSNGAFNRRARLTGRQEQWLIVNDAPPIQNMRVGTDRMTAPLGIHACHPEVSTDLQAHQVAGGFITMPPVVRERLPEQELHDAVVGTAQSAFLFEQP